MSSVTQRIVSPPKILVVAIGNPDRADDGVGALVATRLAGRLPSDVALVGLTGDILSVIEDWACCRRGHLYRRCGADGSAGAHPSN